MARESGSFVFGSEGQWQQTVLGRAVVGLVLAQGLYYGLWQLGTAVVVATVTEANRAEWWNTPQGWTILQFLQAFSLLMGGLLTGAGQRSGFLYGMGLGLVNSILYLLVQFGIGRQLSTAEIYGQPAFQTICAGIGGLLGSQIWKPVAMLTVPKPTIPVLTNRATVPMLRPRRSPFDGPIHWFRVIVGSMIAILGSAWANLILKFMLEASEGRLSLESERHAKFVTWEISALALLFGSALAGSNAHNGLKQGFVVGLATLIVLLSMYYQIGTPRSAPAQTLMFDLIGLQIGGLNPAMQNTIYSLATIPPMGMLGGWFGGQLLPPLVPGRKRRHLIGASA